VNEARPGEGNGPAAPPVQRPPESSELDVFGIGALLRTRLFRARNGLLPIILGLVLIAIFFQSQNAQFLSAGNLVNLLVQGSVYMLIGMGQVYVLLLGEIDLSLGFVAGIAATVMTQLIQPLTGWPWWSAILAGLAVAAILGLVQGTLITRLRLPSFVVTLAGLLGFEGVMIYLLGEGGTIPIQDRTIINLANGTLSPAASWILVGVGVAAYALITLIRNAQRRGRGLTTASPVGTALRIGAAAVAGIVLVLLCNVDRNPTRFATLQGVPWALLIVFAVLLASSFLLTRTRFGRYVHAIGGNAEAARRAGVNLAAIRTAAFTIAAFIAGIGGIIYASRLTSISTSFDGGTIVLYVVATAVIGGTSLFGGRGHPLHAILGGVVIAAIVNGMALLGLPAAIQLMATAVVLLVSITVDVVVRRRGETSR
jgi:D-xylose transport system permease protein